jgi:hypothetical protein
MVGTLSVARTPTRLAVEGVAGVNASLYAHRGGGYLIGMALLIPAFHFRCAAAFGLFPRGHLPADGESGAGHEGWSHYTASPP